MRVVCVYVCRVCKRMRSVCVWIAQLHLRAKYSRTLSPACTHAVPNTMQQSISEQTSPNRPRKVNAVPSAPMLLYTRTCTHTHTHTFIGAILQSTQRYRIGTRTLKTSTLGLTRACAVGGTWTLRTSRTASWPWGSRVSKTYILYIIFVYPYLSAFLHLPTSLCRETK